MNAVHPEPAAGGNAYNRGVITEFRASAGAVGGSFAGTPLLLLTTWGRRSGEPRTTPLVHLTDAGRTVVFASNGGAPADPDWYRNLAARPEVTVELGAESFPALAVPVADENWYEALWAAQIAAQPSFAAFRTRAGRVVPLVELRRAAG
ncbi:nitroreductase/quinone reductase family protein [Kitasatospora sp. NPDC050463]|uniref:nitroreductase/quinone reductase family protein n=1 Tax=Kitasatospora sp. NPDC050463 TaxID=3155786 RepID=UPI0033C054E9